MLDSSAPGNEGDDDQQNFKDPKRAGDDSHVYIDFYSGEGEDHHNGSPLILTGF